MIRVVVVGGGNAALCAAISARECGAEVIVFERAPYETRGGNSRFTGGGMRTSYAGVEDLLKLVPDLSSAEIESSEFGTYSEDDFYFDLSHLSHNRGDLDLQEKVVGESLPTLCWMRQKGVRFLPAFRRQSFKVEGKQKFWGGLSVEVNGGGAGLVDALTQIALKDGVSIRYDSRVTDLAQSRKTGKVDGVVVNGATVSCDGVVLACGGFESNPMWRARYLGPNWDLAKVRGTRFNTGDGISMALNIGAMPRGHWSGCHSVAWDMNAPDFGDLDVADEFQKHSYPLGIVVNSSGRRFLDEGPDFRNYTYARYGAEILNQEGQQAWQVFDAKTKGMLRGEYLHRQVTSVTSSTLEGLARAMSDVNVDGFLDTVSRFNASVHTDVPFNPAILDGRSADDGTVPKSNWANTISDPPFEAYEADAILFGTAVGAAHLCR